MREHIELRVLRSLANHPTSLLQEKHSFCESPAYIKQLESQLRSTVMSTEAFSYNYMLASLLKKWTGWTSNSETLEEDTFAVWLDCERKCFETNYYFKGIDDPRLTPEIPAARLINEVRSKIVELIGHCPPYNWKEACDWPTGATSNAGRRTNVGDKVCKVNSSSEVASVIGAEYLYLNDLQLERGNRLTFVPKSYKVMRPIACEPTLNAFLQKGVGRTLRSLLLRRVGIDIRYQAELNREYAFLARDCDLSTLDLESASDTISSSVVHLLFPPSWCSLFESLRSPYSIYGERKILLEKHASMGNGYIFELETVLFTGIVRAVASLLGRPDAVTAVFGDDIIVERGCYDLTCSALRYFGFRINLEKSFKTGDFFESCGRHYHCNLEVTPPYQKDRCKSLFQLVVFHNKLYRWAHRTGFQSAVKEALRLIKDEARTLTPVRKYGLPVQPAFLKAEYGFISRNWGHFDKNGDIILKVSLDRRTKLGYLDTNHQFYLDNWLRCLNSICCDRTGRPSREEKSLYRIRKNRRVWKSGAEDETP